MYIKSFYLYIIVILLNFLDAKPVKLFMTPWTVARQAPLSMELSRQEYWSGLPFTTTDDLPDPGIQLTALMPPVLPYFKIVMHNVIMYGSIFLRCVSKLFK